MSRLTGVQIAKLLSAQYKYPHSVLGLHRVTRGADKGLALRFFDLGAESAEVVHAETKERTPMEKLHGDGLFEARFPSSTEIFDYKIAIVRRDGKARTVEDAYNPKFKSMLKKEDIDAFVAGDHPDIYRVLGGRIAKNAGVPGVNFTVWAPCAKYVSVAGVFNGWSGRTHPMHYTGRNGLWELFVPGLKEGSLYKFVIRSRDGKTLVKSDPYAYAAQFRPKKSSIVWDLEKFAWQDEEWLKARAGAKHYHSPMTVYEVHPGSWIRKGTPEQPFYNYREIAEDLIPYVKEMGYTHIELMPVMEHPLDESWGYQVTSYFAPTSRFGTPDDFMFFVNECHKAGIGVLLDWVPAHFPRDPHGLARFDGSHLYEHADPRQGFHPDWKTAIFNFGRHEVKSFLISSALFWVEKYHVDGIRVDAVASMLYLDYSRKPGQWVPNKYGGNENLEAIAFMRSLNKAVHERHPGVVTIAEESTAWSGVSKPYYVGGLGFSYKWNMGWMHDTLEYLTRKPYYRRYHHGKLTFMLDYAFREKYMLVLSHDEVVHGKRSLLKKMPGTKEEKFANLRMLYGFQYTHPGKKLLFMGGEFAQAGEWGVNRELDWELLEQPEHESIQKLVKDLNHVYRDEPALHEEDHWDRGFQWVDNRDMEQSIISFLRKSSEERRVVLVVANFSAVPRSGYRVGVPRAGYWREIFNTNASIYGGSDIGNFPGVKAEEGRAHHGLLHSVVLTLPPLSLLMYRSDGHGDRPA